MKIRASLLPVGLFVGCLLALLGWAEWTNWRELTQLRRRLSEVELESVAAEFQAHLLSIHGSLLDKLASPAVDDKQQDFRVTSGQLATWLSAHETILNDNGSHAETQRIGRVRTHYAVYRETVTKSLDNARPAASKDLPEKIVSLDAALAPLLLEVEAWKRVHHDALVAEIAAVKRSLDVLHGLLLGSYVLLVSVAVTVAWLVHRGFIAPLHRELAVHQKIIARQEKLVSLGVLAAGVAHEIRNPLTAIKARLFSQQKNLAAGSSESVDAQIISGEITRLERIVREVLLFARPDDPVLETRIAGEFLREVGDFLASTLEKQRIVLHLALVGDLPLRVDPAQMRQVLINLIQNAAESIGENGTITLRARRTTSPLSSEHAAAVALEVEDTGPGIPPEVQERLFDPFFTTKASGTGLGLAIAARIVQKHGGLLEYRTAPGAGTTFIVVLPLG